VMRVGLSLCIYGKHKVLIVNQIEICGSSGVGKVKSVPWAFLGC
jgi:hypothetical protein